MNVNKENVDLVTSKVDWLTQKQGSQLVMAFLLVIVIILAVLQFNSEQKDIKRYENLSSEVDNCKKIQDANTKLLIENSRLKSNIVLVKALRNFSPNPEWITDKGGLVVWVNPAYVKRHLTPLGYTAQDIIGTTGAHIFGTEMAVKFKASNDLVLLENRPLTIAEIVDTTKFPIKVGEVIFGIGGTEYYYYK